ncbi:DUF4136 domain-containing protein [Tenacibaculum piscium]|uniref:DUF4136 domain-containing protein n=1 Tax=Tenacibaculum piscium TaxID=1458515 RepID=A0A2H1YIC1_9FLAO|nr:DUF4136 domain-containing protein [Tenacibaculum piscium]MBE7628454.1 DUF4136 domain-containing protein [Tenacibaculum piscium]MBE7669594.1 DUF4136 domain-containing protein [Tenacibaculum piscium]SOS75242.1 conserved hypothetical protein [Tenacibaculum piscium]
MKSATLFSFSIKSLTKSLILLMVLFLITSCVSVNVATDYDTKVNFKNYKTFAFYKKGIDKATISDLDKRRIMRAIEQELTAKGMTKSDSPDILVSIFTKSTERIMVTDNFYGGFYYPYYYGINPIQVSKYTQGTLFIDILDAQKKELVWQGIGTGTLSTRNVEQKQARIKEFVAEIMAVYPPEISKK